MSNQDQATCKKPAEMIELTAVFTRCNSPWYAGLTWKYTQIFDRTERVDVDPNLIEEIGEPWESHKPEAKASVKLSNGRTYNTAEDRETIKKRRAEALKL